MKSHKRAQPLARSRLHYESFREDLRGLLSVSDCFRDSYLLRVFETKLLDPAYADSAAVRRSRAIEKWLKTEELNADTNQRLMFSDEADILFVTDEGPVSYTDIRGFARSLISDTIGLAPDFEALVGSFSNGASTSQKRGAGIVPRKYQRGVDCTERAYARFQQIVKTVCWFPEPNYVPGNVLFTVPKSTTIDRCACKEPDINMYCMKAVGDYFRQSLRKKGINLNDQKVNQELALAGSLTGELATVDLSSASDTVTTQLIVELLPFEWTSLLMDLRSPTTMVDGEIHENEMFSSMGNAFTFELESLVFWALTRSVTYFTRTRGRVSVYGDDIICPVKCRDALLATFAWFGFKINVEKSFFDGPFRESCGKHYHQGKDVTPFYIRKVPVDVSDWIHILNSLRAWLDRSAIIGFLDSDFFPLWKKYSELVPLPLHGGWDYGRRDVLVSSGRRPVARVAPKQRRALSAERQYQLGAYLQWLDTAAGRSPDKLIDTPLVTSEFTLEGSLAMQRFRSESWSRAVSAFVEEST